MFRNKGITLISLVITIVILLILAGVAISVAINGNGIFTKAKEAVGKWNNSVLNEEIEINKIFSEYNNIMSEPEVPTDTTGPTVNITTELGLNFIKVMATATDTESGLADTGTYKFFINGIEKETNATGNYIFTGLAQNTNYTIKVIAYDKVGNEGSVTRSATTTIITLVELYDAGELKIGDYVNYNPIAKGDTGTEAKYTVTSYGADTGLTYDQTYKVDPNTKWRVLGVEGEGSARHIILKSADPIAKEIINISDDKYYRVENGAKGYLNYITELNKISSIYGHGKGATGARSINVDDINKITGVAVTASGLSPNVDQLGEYGKQYSFENQYTPETWLNGKTTTTVAGTVNAYTYKGDAVGLQTNATTNPKMGARLYEMLFADTDNKGYWLATRTTSMLPSGIQYNAGFVYGNAVRLHLPLFASTGQNTYIYILGGVCPVVSLESGVTEETIQKIPDQPREDWGNRSHTDGSN